MDGVVMHEIWGKKLLKRSFPPERNSAKAAYRMAREKRRNEVDGSLYSSHLTIDIEKLKKGTGTKNCDGRLPSKEGGLLLGDSEPYFGVLTGRRLMRGLKLTRKDRFMAQTPVDRSSIGS